MASDWYDEDTQLDDDSVGDDNDVVTASDNRLTKQQKLDVRRRLEDRAESKRLKSLIDDFYDFDIEDAE